MVALSIRLSVLHVQPARQLEIRAGPKYFLPSVIADRWSQVVQVIWAAYETFFSARYKVPITLEVSLLLARPV